MSQDSAVGGAAGRQRDADASHSACSCRRAPGLTCRRCRPGTSAPARDLCGHRRPSRQMRSPLSCLPHDSGAGVRPCGSAASARPYGSALARDAPNHPPVVRNADRPSVPVASYRGVCHLVGARLRATSVATAGRRDRCVRRSRACPMTAPQVSAPVRARLRAPMMPAARHLHQ